MTTLDAQHRELAWCEKDIRRAQARLEANPHDLNAKRWLEAEVAHRERVLSWLRACGVTKP